MNKEKLARIKHKIQKHATAITTVSVLATTVTVVALRAKKFLDENSSWGEEFQLDEVTGENREELLSNDGFALLHITDDEYMFVRRNPED